MPHSGFPGLDSSLARPAPKHLRLPQHHQADCHRSLGWREKPEQQQAMAAAYSCSPGSRKNRPALISCPPGLTELGSTKLGLTELSRRKFLLRDFLRQNLLPLLSSPSPRATKSPLKSPPRTPGPKW